MYKPNKGLRCIACLYLNVENANIYIIHILYFLLAHHLDIRRVVISLKYCIRII